jgi:hypothetical protein
MSSATIDQPVEFTLPNPTGSSGGPVRSPDLDPAAEKRPETPPASLGTPELDAIYQENSRPIYYLALRMLGDPTQAEDATHDVFLKAYRKLGEFKGQSSIRTWLYRITINHCQKPASDLAPSTYPWHRR